MKWWQWTKITWTVQLRKQNQILQWFPPKDRQISIMKKNQRLLHPMSLCDKIFFPHFSPQNLIFTFIFHFTNLKRLESARTGVFLQIFCGYILHYSDEYIKKMHSLLMQICLVKFWTWLIFVPNFDLYKFDTAIMPYYLCFITL